MKERGFHCAFPGCPRRYASKYNVRRHMTCSHQDFHQYECPTCHKILSSKQNFKQHQYIHTGDRPYVCDICGDGYRQGSQLSNHRRGHLVEARTLPICKVKIMQLTDLLKFSDDWTLNAGASRSLVLPILGSEPRALPELVERKEEAEMDLSVSAFSFHIPQP